LGYDTRAARSRTCQHLRQGFDRRRADASNPGRAAYLASRFFTVEPFAEPWSRMLAFHQAVSPHLLRGSPPKGEGVAAQAAARRVRLSLDPKLRRRSAAEAVQEFVQAQVRASIATMLKSKTGLVAQEAFLDWRALQREKDRILASHEARAGLVTIEKKDFPRDAKLEIRALP
jgi:hypothetical protein